MAELYTSRAKFAKNQQRAFIVKSSKALGWRHSEVAYCLNISPRTLTDWKREKFLMTIKAAEILSRRSRVQLPRNLEIREPFWYISRESSSRGGRIIYKRYGRIGGDPAFRQRKWREWWEKEGQFRPHPILSKRIPIKKPEKSETLAEFVGILIGDGGISKRQVAITLHRIDDKEYMNFVVNMARKLFQVKPAIYHDKNGLADDIVISRTELVDFCIKHLGLKLGNKIAQQIDIPDWIKRNRKFRFACVRGLVDTDGSIFTHNYRVHGKLYSYKKLSFTSFSKPLVLSVHNIFREIGLKPRLTQGRDVRLDSIYDMQRYFQVVGSHNPKHLKRYKN